MLADPVPPDIAFGKVVAGGEGQEVKHQEVQVDMLSPSSSRKPTKGKHKARTTQMQLGLISQKPVQQGLLRAKAPKAAGACSGPQQQM